MKRICTAFVLLLLLGACAQSPNSEETGAELSPERTRARVHTELATAYYGAGQYNVALEEVKIALGADKDYLPAVNQLGLIYLALGQTDDAKRELQRAMRIDPDDPSINNNFGMLMCSMGNAKEAMRYFEKALGNPLYRTPEFAYVNAGVCLKNEGEYTRSEQFLRRALALAPDQPQALYHMADLKFTMGDAASAQTFITRYLQLVVPGPDALWLAARIEQALGNYVALESYGAQLNRRFPDSTQARAFNQGLFK